MAQVKRYLTIFISLCALTVFLFYCQPKNIHIFPGLTGPAEATIIPKAHTTPYEKYSKGTKSRLAILLTDAESNWLGLVHGLKTIGVPFLVTTDYEKALQHKVVMVYPIISGKKLNPSALRALAEFPKNGGTLIGSNALAGGMREVFGFKKAKESKNHITMTFSEDNTVTSSFSDLSQTKIRIGTTTHPELNVGATSYSQPQHPPIAVYEDGTAAITYKPYNTGGKAYAVGLDYGQLLLKGYNGREENIAEHFVNHYEPTLDALLLLIKNIYTQSHTEAVTLDTVPFGKSLSVMITHDVDYIRSMKNSITYAEFERSEGISATYFIQAKYLRDFYDNVFLDDQGANYIRRLEELGMEVASHSVSHSLQFNKFPIGTGEETYPDYRPFVHSKTRTSGGTMLGELRVSKFLLEQFLENGEVISFRPGHLRNPHVLPQLLLATGYQFSAATTANNSLTHLPFQLNRSREHESELEIFEFPITVEDERLPKMGDRLDEAIDLAETLKKYGAAFIILIHPDILGHKLEFEKGFVNHVKDYAWFGTISEFGKWWVARNSVDLDVKDTDDGKLLVTISAPEKIQGLTLSIPMGYHIAPVPDDKSNLSQSGSKVTIAQVEGIQLITLEKM